MNPPSTSFAPTLVPDVIMRRGPGDGWIVELNPAGDALVSTTVTLTDGGRLRTPVQGPDGALYVTTSNGSDDAILRITRS